MTVFRVWAPLAGAVELELGERCVAMVPAGGGWHELDVPEAGAGSDYRFVLDGGRPLPDPRSSWQPAGVDGPSRVVDHDAFAWTDDGWRGVHLPSAVIYELHVGTFTEEGTFDAVIAKLDHLVDLGVTAVELLPVAQFPGERGWGYDGVDLYAPHAAYGGPDGLKRLVDACHARRLAVVMDVVYNHLGPAGNYLGQFGPYFTDRYATPWGAAVNFDGEGSDEVRAFVVDNALQWLRDYHCDGLRLDAVHGIVDTSATHILEQLAVRVEELGAALGRPLFLVAESDLNDPRVVRRREVGGYGMDAQWSDDFHHALHAVLTGERDGYYADFGSLGQLATALERAFVYGGEYSPYRGRSHGRRDPALGGQRFLGYLQNHDQIGNRAQGDRSAALMSVGRLYVAAALVLAGPFVPMLFQGEEWGATTPFQYFTDHEDPELGRAVSEGRRREFASFGWDPVAVPDPQDRVTFERSKLNWGELEREPHRGLLEWHRHLIRLRQEVPALSDGRLDRVHCRYDEAEGWLVVERGAAAVAANLGAADVELAVRGRVLAASGGALPAEGGVRLAPDSVAVLAET
ncbi:MAG: malto-oligosyltrehalose trehalohydrolase, partial [Actinomycetota bacterium]|nr:malto-oligosyltrehalose trehalohydrolase [Actinomycetota bacterium]